MWLQLNEIGSLLENVCRTVPAGIVCFFPSYDYEQLVYQHLEKNKVISRLSERKKVNVALSYTFCIIEYKLI